MKITGVLPGDIELLAMRGIAQARADQKEPALQTTQTLINITDDRIAQAWATIIQELILKTDGNNRRVRNVLRFDLPPAAKKQPHATMPAHTGSAPGPSAK